jgi:hypothetical protein
MFRLNRNKQKTNRNCLIGSIFCYFFYRKIEFFRFFSFFRVSDLILYGCICLNMVRYDRVCDLICDRFSAVQRFSCSEFQRFQVFQGFQGFQVSKVSLAQCRVNVGRQGRHVEKSKLGFDYKESAV